MKEATRLALEERCQAVLAKRSELEERCKAYNRELSVARAEHARVTGEWEREVESLKSGLGEAGEIVGARWHAERGRLQAAVHP